MTDTEKIAEFARLVRAHDPTDDRSDDFREYTKGLEQYRAIVNLAREIPRAEAVRIWNTEAIRKLGATHAMEYLWRE